MAGLQTGISYWLSVAIRAIQTFPTFIGNNWVGVLLSFALLLPGARAAIKKHLPQISALAWSGRLLYTGRLLMRTNWRIVAAIIGMFLIGSFLTVGFRDYANATEQDRKTKEQLDDASLRLNASAVTCQLQTNAVTDQRDAEAAKNQTLEKQNRDQQGTINGCLSQAMTLLTPEPLKVTPLLLDSTPDAKDGDIKKVRWLVLVNKTVTPLQMNVICNKAVQDGGGWIVGSGAMIGGAGNVAPNVIGIGIASPAWGPISPLLVSMSYRGTDADLTCSFNPR